jgi:hypothetical protein
MHSISYEAKPSIIDVYEPYLIAGGAPAGINNPLPGDDGCRTNIARMKITTIQGNNNTTPRGTEMVELPFNRRGRLKNASLDEVLVLFPISFIVGRSVADGKRFIARRTTSIAARHLCRAEVSQTKERTRRDISSCCITRK